MLECRAAFGLVVLSADLGTAAQHCAHRHGADQSGLWEKSRGLGNVLPFSAAHSNHPLVRQGRKGQKWEGNGEKWGGGERKKGKKVGRKKRERGEKKRGRKGGKKKGEGKKSQQSKPKGQSPTAPKCGGSEGGQWETEPRQPMEQQHSESRVLGKKAKHTKKRRAKSIPFFKQLGGLGARGRRTKIKDNHNENSNNRR